MRILLTGATGFLGNNLLRLLNERQWPVVALLRHSSPPESLMGLEYHPFPADLSRLNRAELDQLPDFDLCIHSAAVINIGWTRLAEARAVNVEATRQLAALCHSRGARMVLVSTVNTLACSRSSAEVRTENDREPACPPFCYPVTKREGERVVEEMIGRGLDAVTVHPGYMLGRWDWRPSSAEMIIAVARQKPPFAPAGGTNTADVRQVAEGVLLAGTNGRSGENYILGGENLSYFDLWTRMAKVVGVRGPKIRLPNSLAHMGGMAGDLWTRLRGQEGSLNSAAARMGQLFHYYSSAKATVELGYQHGPIDPAIIASAEWCREREWI